MPPASTSNWSRRGWTWPATTSTRTSGRWLAEVQNASLASLAAAHPDRFHPVAAVPLQAPVVAAQVLRHAVTDLGHRAVQIGTHVNEVGPRRSGPRCVLGLRSRSWTCRSSCTPAELNVPERVRRLFLHILVGNPSETTFAAAALLLGGVLERHPRLRVLLVHGGGFVPYQFGRIERGFTTAPPALRSRAPGSPRRFLDQLYFDTILHDEDALGHLLTFAGPGHVALGSDYPFPMRLDDPVGSLDALRLAPPERERILGASDLFAKG